MSYSTMHSEVQGREELPMKVQMNRGREGINPPQALLVTFDLMPQAHALPNYPLTPPLSTQGY
jgi:hypothetical protein